MTTVTKTNTQCYSARNNCDDTEAMFCRGKRSLSLVYKPLFWRSGGLCHAICARLCCYHCCCCCCCFCYCCSCCELFTVTENVTVCTHSCYTSSPESLATHNSYQRLYLQCAAGTAYTQLLLTQPRKLACTVLCQ
jgi:hypothetical protein